MTDVDPKIWDNPTLGSVGAGPFLDEVEQQALENLRAQQAGVEPRIAVHFPRHPMYAPESTPSDIHNVEFIDPPSREKIEFEPTPVDIPEIPVDEDSDEEVTNDDIDFTAE